MLSDFQRYWHGDQGEPRFLIDWREPGQPLRHWIAALGAVAWHVAFVLFIVNAPGGFGRSNNAAQFEIVRRNVMPLVAPRLDPDEFKLTQKAPQAHTPATEVDLASLLPKPQLNQPLQRPEHGSSTPGIPLPPKPAVQPIEAPKIDIPQQGDLAGMNNPLLPARQPAPPPPEKNKNPFEPVGGPQGGAKGQMLGLSRNEAPKSGIEDATRAIIRSGANGRGMTIGDADNGSGGSSDPLRQRGSPGPQHSALELLSDPQGVDFKSYLIQVLAAVRRSWFSVLPESARFGRSGRVIIQFAVNRDGQVPKLVIYLPSGTEALDRAAVAGVSGAVPLPPLPTGFKGQDVRLQLVFSYNMPK
jgi:TonB family protein